MSTLFEQFSSRENLKRAYKYVQNELAHSSLSVNPINHPSLTSIEAVGEQFFIALEKYIRDGEYRPERGFFVYIPKDNLGLRPVCVLSMIDRIVYQAMFNQSILGYKIDGQLSDKVCFSNRVNDDESAESFLSPYFNGWEDFCKEQKKAFEKGCSWKLEVDVQQYYEHIPAGRLIDKLKNDFDVQDEKILEILKAQLCSWAEYPELPKGIPQGPDPSSVLGNVYLASLDVFAEKELIGKELRYFRYADDITLMGKTKEDVLKATEKIVRFLREHNLTLNEKTKLSELKDAETIEAMRFFSDYEDDTPEIPEDDFTRVQNNAPIIVEALENGDKVERSDVRELKYFLRVDTTYNDVFMMRLIELIPCRPSLTVPIVRYVSEGRKTLDAFDASIIDYTLWRTYNDSSISEWSRFWILKLLVSNKDVRNNVEEIEKEVEAILASKENTIFKMVCFYYQAIQGNQIDIDQIKRAVEGSKTDMEKSLYSFFLLNALQGARASTVKNSTEQLLTSQSHEINLIGSYIFKNKPEASIVDFSGTFSVYLFGKNDQSRKLVEETSDKHQQDSYYLIRGADLKPITTSVPISSPSAIFGVNRPKKKKRGVELIFPEKVQWDKVVLKIKEGLQDVEIWYDNQHIKTASYIELGFSSNKKDYKPDRKWNFLCILSVLQNEDITKATSSNLMPMLASHSGRATTRANVHTTKKILSMELKDIFATSDNPFIENKRYYEPKFKVLPEAMMRTKELWKQGGTLNENIDYGETQE